MVLGSEFDQALERARRRAEAKNISAVEAERTTSGHDRIYWFRVNSFSRSGTEHGVKLSYTSEGIAAVCSCEGGQRELICMHIAASMAAIEAGIGDEPEPTPTVAERGAAALSLLNGDDATYQFGQSA